MIAEANPAVEELLGRSSVRLLGTPMLEAVAIADERVRAPHPPHPRKKLRELAIHADDFTARH